MTDMKRTLTISTFVLAVLAALQLIFAAICAYMVAAINDSVWHGVKLDDLALTAFMIGFITACIAIFAAMFRSEFK